MILLPVDPFEDATWADPLGPTRREQAARRMSHQCWIGIDDAEPWVSREVDRECLEMAYMFLALISPVTAPGRDRDAIVVYGALSAVFDTCATKRRRFTEEELLAKKYRGRPVGEWADRVCTGLDEWTANTLQRRFHHQIAQLSENRLESGIGPSEQRNERNRTDYRSYLRWREREGWYYGGLLACAVATGVDLRDVPPHWIEETLEASVLAFDIHGSLRHACEKEIGHTLNYLPGTQHEKVTTSLVAYTEILFRLQGADDIKPRDKEYLTRFVMGIVAGAYSCRRYAKTTPLHIARPEDVAVAWSHVDNTPDYRFSYAQVTAEGAPKPGRARPHS
ncbi:hypothetical protein [Streptomyces sp. NRRL B-1347]|uniref:hypothetical protein n=1 Tax=Streptomyces sp. NRRL B-1347 TaxID=1476877 RepID=UPI0004C580F8|nr:hypothetical protein [Streptomyces sp. NRRL B-1347]